MCGKETMVSDGHGSNTNSDKKQQKQESSNIIIEEIDGTCYTFHTADCALIFKKLCGVYGSNFADELYFDSVS
jgi:hypothetical protein